MHKLPGVPLKNGSEIHGAVAELSREPRSEDDHPSESGGWGGRQ